MTVPYGEMYAYRGSKRLWAAAALSAAGWWWIGKTAWDMLKR